MNNNYREQETLEIATYFLERQSTVRGTAQALKVSKSKVHNHLTKFVPLYYPSLVNSVNSLLAKNKAERHMRGGLSTKKMYEARRSS